MIVRFSGTAVEFCCRSAGNPGEAVLDCAEFKLQQRTAPSHNLVQKRSFDETFCFHILVTSWSLLEQNLMVPVGPACVPVTQLASGEIDEESTRKTAVRLVASLRRTSHCWCGGVSAIRPRLPADRGKRELLGRHWQPLCPDPKCTCQRLRSRYQLHRRGRPERAELRGNARWGHVRHCQRRSLLVPGPDRRCRES